MNHTANTKQCPSCKSSWIHRNSKKVYTCQTCSHVFTEPLVIQPKGKPNAGSGQKAGPVVIGKMMANWPQKRRSGIA